MSPSGPCRTAPRLRRFPSFADRGSRARISRSDAAVIASVRHQLGMPVALDDLRRHRRRFEAEPRADARFDRGIEMGERPDGAGDLADRHHVARSKHPVQIALKLGVPQRELQAERHRLGMDAMRSANHRRQPMFLGATRTASRRPAMPLTIRSACLPHLQRLRRVHHVGRRQAEMEPSRRRSHFLGDSRRERDDVVLGCLLDFLDPGDVERRLRSKLSRAASGGTRPASAMASAAASSTSSQVS